MLDYEMTTQISIEKGIKSHIFEMPSMHTHLCHELYFLISGQRRYLIGHTIYDVSPGNVVIIPKNQLHRTTMLNRKGHSRFVVYFSEEYMEDFIRSVGREAFDSLLTGGCFQLHPEHVQFVASCLRKMEQEQKLDAPYARAVIKNALQDILLVLLRHGGKKEQITGVSAHKIQDVTRYISEHYAQDITLEDAARMAFMEKTYFSKCFKSLTGFGFCEYLTRIRIRAAEEYLQFSDYSISRISERCGFSSSNYFGDVFRRCNGISPTQFRKKFHQ